MANLLKLLEPLLTITETDTQQKPLDDATTHSEELKCDLELKRKAPKSDSGQPKRKAPKSDFGQPKPSLKKKNIKKKKESKGMLKKKQIKKKKQNKITKKNFL